MSYLHRIVWIDEQIRQKCYPNCRTIAEKFEISTRQASRDIEYMRDSLLAPIQYSSRHRGYDYGDAAFVLPTMFITEQQKQTLQYLSEQYQSMEEERAVELAALFSRLAGNQFPMAEGQSDIPAVPVKKEEIQCFHLLREAIEARRKVEIRYRNTAEEYSTRTFCPYKLFKREVYHYVVGFCELRNEIRVFRLDRMQGIEMLDQVFQVLEAFDGSMYGDEADPFFMRVEYKAVIQFSVPEVGTLSTFSAEPMENNLYRITFYDIEAFFSSLVLCPCEFTIISPNWLKNWFGKRLQKLSHRYL